MFGFLSLNALFLVFLFCLTFGVLTLAPLGLIFFYKRRRPPRSLELLEKCIRYGGHLPQCSCREINRELHKIQATLAALQASPGEHQETPVPPGQALESLPLVYEISLEDTCCEGLSLDQPVPRFLDCKSVARQLWRNLEKHPEDPIIGPKVEEIIKINRKIKTGRRARRAAMFFSLLCFSGTATLLAQTILGQRTTWQLESAIYLASLLYIAYTYKYHYIHNYRHYQKIFHHRG